MNRLTDWLKKQKTKNITYLVALFFVLTSMVIMDEATAAQNIAIPARKGQVVNPITEKVINPEPQISQESQDAFQRLITKTQSSFDKVLTDTKQTIGNLPQQLEQVSTETDSGIRKQIKNDLEDKQDDLEDAADTVDDLAEDLQDFYGKLQKSIEESRPANNSDFQNNVQKAQLSLENAAKSLENLADDTERAKKNNTPVFRTQIDREIKTVNEDLDEANQAIQTLKPAQS